MKTVLTSILLFLFTPLILPGQRTGKVIAKDGLEINYTHYGKGKDLVVFVHGWSCDQRYWKEQVGFFIQDYQVVTLDLGGHGHSGIDRDQWTISAFGDDVAAVVEPLKYRDLYLVGHSMGGMVVLDAATKLKARRMKIFPVDVLERKFWPISEEVFQNFIKPFKEDFQGQTKKWVSNGMFVEDTDPELIEWISDDMSQAPPDIAIAAIHDLWIRNYDPTIANLNERKIPMILINRRELNEQNKKSLTEIGFQIEVIPQVGHFIMMEKPEAFNRRLKQFIK